MSRPTLAALLTVAALFPALALAQDPAAQDPANPADPVNPVDPNLPPVEPTPPTRPLDPTPDTPIEPTATVPPEAAVPDAALKPAAPEPVVITPAPEPEPWIKARIVTELGFADILDHTIQLSKDGTDFDYVNEGGQDTLFPYMRLSAEATIKQRHTLIFVYAPLDLTSKVLLDRDVRVDGETFEEGTPLDLRYNFPVFRISYLYDFIDKPGDEIAIGASLQLRNAIIDFTSADGAKRRSNRNVGPVPILKFRAKKTLKSGVWFGAEIDGFYANIKYLNGGDEDIKGSILDASARVGVSLTDDLDAFFNARYFGGGAEGTNSDDDGPGDGYNKNWLHASTITVGFIYEL